MAANQGGAKGGAQSYNERAWGMNIKVSARNRGDEVEHINQPLAISGRETHALHGRRDAQPLQTVCAETHIVWMPGF